MDGGVHSERCAMDVWMPATGHGQRAEEREGYRVREEQGRTRTWAKDDDVK